MKIKKILLLIVLPLVLFASGNVYAMEKVSCGNITNIPAKIPELSHYIVNLLQVAVPVILVIFGSIDLFKGIMASKEDEIKKGQHIFIKRLIIAIVIFFVVAIVKFIVSMLDTKQGNQNIVECIDCFISGECSSQNSYVYCKLDGYNFKFDSKTGDLNNVLEIADGSDRKNINTLKDKSSDFKVTSNINCPAEGSAYVDTTVVDGKITGVHLKKR